MGRLAPESGLRVFPLVLAALLAAAVVVTAAAPRGAGPWVFSYFLDNGQDGMRLAHSRDGLKWTPLGDGRPYLAPTVGGKLIRDPFIILGPDNVFHAVWTTGWYEQGIGISHSRDLKTWTALGAELEMPAGARHGSVLAVPEKILKGLLASTPAGPAAVEHDGVQR